MESIKSHIENHIQVLIDDLRVRVLFMAAKSQQAFSDSVKAFETLDIDLAQKVTNTESEIDDLELEIDASALNILARTQPVASDLRLLLSTVRLVVDLERIGDESVNIANNILSLKEQNALIAPPAIVELCKKALALLDEGVQSFRDKDTSIAKHLRSQSDEIAKLSVLALDYCTRALHSNEIEPRVALSYIIISRSVDRIASRAINIAEHTYFVVEGINLKHQQI